MRFLIIILLLSCNYKVQDADINRVKSNITKLASDELEGRATGSKAEEKAADLIINQFKGAGLKPLLANFKVPFEYKGDVELEDASFHISKYNLNINEDFKILPFSANLSKEDLTAVFANYGIVSKKDKYNDYNNLNIKGKVVFIMKGYPENQDAHSSIAFKSDLREKARTARDLGAVAIVEIDDYLAPVFAPINVNKDAGIAVLKISQQAFQGMFKERPKTMKRGRKLSRKVKIDVNLKKIDKTPNNIIGLKEGKIKDKYIVLGAHYDHLGIGNYSGAYLKNYGQIHNGADDNASGTAALIELAHILKDYENHYSLLFIAFSGEELGLLGSKALFNDKHLNPEDLRLMINMDMVGRLDKESKELTVYGTKTAIEFDTIVQNINKPFSFKLKPIAHSPGNSDHAAFYQEKVPVLFFNTSLHGDYHKPTDDAEKINMNGITTISNYVRDLIFKLDSEDQTVTYNLIKEPNKGKVRKFSVYIGTLPNYGYQGKGFKIDGASPGSPAEKAGLLKGDIITSLNNQKVENIYDYMGVLSSLKAGQKVSVLVKREEKLLTLSLTPGSKN